MLCDDAYCQEVSPNGKVTTQDKRLPSYNRLHPVWGLPQRSQRLSKRVSKLEKKTFLIHCTVCFKHLLPFCWHVHLEVLLVWARRPPSQWHILVDKAPLLVHRSRLACVVSAACTLDIILTPNNIYSLLHSFVSMKGVSDQAVIERK